VLLNRLVHYFATYKMDMTGGKPNATEIAGTYGAAHAREVVLAALADYAEEYGEAEE
jgi:inorganic pyrophosphatase